jgi:hypothetical protein
VDLVYVDITQVPTHMLKKCHSVILSFLKPSNKYFIFTDIRAKLAFDWVVVHLHNGNSIHPHQSAQKTYKITYIDVIHK